MEIPANRKDFVDPEMKGGETRGGQLRHFVHNLELLGAPSRVCSIIRGYAIPFPVKPPLRNLQTCLQNLVTPSSQEMDEVVESLLASDMIEECSHPTGFISRMFLVKKQDASFRPIFNLKGLNRFLSTKKFRLLNHFRVPDFLQKGDYLASVDLSQAYCHIQSSTDTEDS